MQLSKSVVISYTLEHRIRMGLLYNQCSNAYSQSIQHNYKVECCTLVPLGYMLYTSYY